MGNSQPIGRRNYWKFFWREKYCWKSCWSSKETIMVFFLRLFTIIFSELSTWNVSWLHNIFTDTVYKQKLTNTITQSQMSPATLQLIDGPTTWFHLQNKLTGFYRCPNNTKILKLPRNIGSKWVKIKEKRAQ